MYTLRVSSPLLKPFTSHNQNLRNKATLYIHETKTRAGPRKGYL